MTSGAPPGYERLALLGADVVVRAEHIDAIRGALAASTLYAWAATHSKRQVLHGRLPAYVAPLPHGGPLVVVRRNHHGGMLARPRKDRFIRSRAPRELDVSLRLTDEGVPTPEIVAYAIYRIRAMNTRTDVVSRKLPAGRDLGAILTDVAPEPLSDAQVHAVSTLLEQMAGVGAAHPDLNVKNIYLTDESRPTAYVLDVDRVRFTDAKKASAANANRLLRSVNKWTKQRNGRLNVAALTAILPSFQAML